MFRLASLVGAEIILQGKCWAAVFAVPHTPYYVFSTRTLFINLSGTNDLRVPVYHLDNLLLFLTRNVKKKTVA